MSGHSDEAMAAFPFDGSAPDVVDRRSMPAYCPVCGCENYIGHGCPGSQPDLHVCLRRALGLAA